MKRHLCILRNNSPTSSNIANAALAEVTLYNVAAYANRHGYDLHVVCEPFVTAKWDHQPILRMMELYDYVFTMGSDIAITRPETPLESFLVPGKCLVVAGEDFGHGNLINEDTKLFTSGEDAAAVIREWDALRPQFEDIEHTVQAALMSMVRAGDSRISVAPLKALQSHPMPGTKTEWKRGDFALHAICVGDDDAKLKFFLRFFGLLVE